jgi:peptide/nickel transport system substrate-binding protein
MTTATRRARPWRRGAALGRLFVALCLPALIHGCHPAPGDGAAGRGGTLIVAQGTDPGALNPAVTTAGSVHPVTDQIFNGLVGLDEEMSPVPELAERWSISDDGRTYTFHLRPGVRWHDGEPFTSADVRFSFEEALLTYHSRTRAALAPMLAGLDTPDPLTVIFRFHEPYAPLLQRLDVVEASIIPRHRFEGEDLLTAPANLTPVGTGPFRFVEYRRGQHVELARNPAYFREGLPHLDRLVFRILPSGTTATMALERGEVDLLPSVPGLEIERLQAIDGVVVTASVGGSGGSFCQDVLIPNLTRPPFDRLEVRRAFYQALDRSFLVARVYFGQGRPSTGPISRELAWAYSGDVRPYPHDAAEAERLLDAAGYPRPPAAGGGSAGASRLRLRFTYPSTHARLAQAVREQVARVGIDLRLEGLDFNTSVEKTFVRKDFDLGFASFCNGADPDIGVRRVYVSTNVAPVPFSNGAGYVNPEVDRLFHEAAVTLDRGRRAELYGELQQRLVEDLPYFWIIDSAGRRAHLSSFTGFRFWTGAFAETVRRSGT